MEEILREIASGLSKPSCTDWLTLIVTFVYCVFTACILFANRASANAAKKQIERMEQHQIQNVGLNLYTKRKEALELFLKKKYDEMYWDSVLLFSDKVAEGVISASHMRAQVETKEALIAEYENLMKNDEPELYEQYSAADANLNEHPDNDSLLNDLFELSDNYMPIYKGPLCDEPILLVYRDLFNDLMSETKKYETEHQKVFLQMKDEIKASIFPKT